MNTWGDAALWNELFPDELVPKVIELIVSTWSRSRSRLPGLSLDGSEDEVKITKWFRAQLINEKTARRLPVVIRRESTVDSVVAPKDGVSELDSVQETGRIDLIFAPANTAMEDNYLTFECKRLNVKFSSGFRSLADRYVSLGMVRFFDFHEYGRKQSHGGMVGYVMDGQIDAAKAEVDKQVKKRKSELNLVASLTQSPLVALDLVMQSTHTTKEAPLSLHHIFLAL